MLFSSSLKSYLAAPFRGRSPVSTDLRDRLQATLGSAYTLEHELGGGGMSRVFAATETALGRKVVVKVLPPELAEGVSVERFKREIQLAARLQHPHIVPVLSAGEMGGLPYYMMPLVNGDSLRTRLSSGKPLPISEVVSILRDVAKALACAHENGVAHRDIKPENVLLTGGSAVVTDFGVAKALSASKTLAQGETLTQVGTSLGTPAYMAPEQVAADPSTDHRADIYAFGVMAYEMLSGRPPFHGRTPQKLIAAQMGERPTPIGELRSDAPPLLAQLVMQCLEKEPDDRPQSAAALVLSLEQVTSGDSHSAMPQILLGGRRRTWRALALYMVVFAIVGLVAKAAIITIGLPDWVFLGAVIVMGVGLPVILFTAFVQHGTYQALTSPAMTPHGTPLVHSTMTKLAVRASPWMSWRKTAVGGAIALGAFVVIVSGFMTMRALGIGPAASLLGAGKLDPKDRLLLADFHASGSDTSLGGVMTEAVRSNLGQSAAVSLASEDAVMAALRRMQRADTSRLTTTLAREVAQREGMKAVVDGDIRPLGRGFLLTLKLLAAGTGDALVTYQEPIDNIQEFLPAIDKLTRKLRGKIGESLKDVRDSPSFEQVSTSSLEALKLYNSGVRALDEEANPTRAVELFNEAIAIDTGFAMAYRKLAIALNQAGRPQAQSDSAYARAYRSRGRLTERERYLAISSYFYPGPGRDRARAAIALEALLNRDSVDRIGLYNLGLLEESRRHLSRASELFRRSIAAAKTGGDSLSGFASLTDSQVEAESLSAAAASLGGARKAFPGITKIWWIELDLLLAEGHEDSAFRFLGEIRTKAVDPDMRSGAMRALAFLAKLHGRIAEGERLNDEAEAQETARDIPAPPYRHDREVTADNALFRQQGTRSADLLDAALARVPLRSLQLSDRPYLDLAATYAAAGRPDEARALLDDYKKEIGPSLARDQEPSLHNALGEIALAEKRPRDALSEFVMADRRPDGPVDGCSRCRLSDLARAYDLAGMSDSTIALYERFLAALRHFTGDGAYVPGAQKRLGELYEARKDSTKASAHYRAFVELWKNADSDLQPRVAEVRQRMARLQLAERR